MTAWLQQTSFAHVNRRSERSHPSRLNRRTNEGKAGGLLDAAKEAPAGGGDTTHYTVRYLSHQRKLRKEQPN